VKEREDRERESDGERGERVIERNKIIRNE